MRRSRLVGSWVAVAVAAAVTTAPTSAAAQELRPPEVAPPAADAAPRPSRRSVLLTGSVVFAAGYLPVAGVAAPSTLGLAARMVPVGLTLGLVCLDGGSGGYVCKGTHGAMQLLIPVVGPILFSDSAPRDSVVNPHGRPIETPQKVMLYASAGVQAVGLGILMAGLILDHEDRALSRAKRAAPTEVPRSALAVRPLVAPNVVGVALGMDL